MQIVYGVFNEVFKIYVTIHKERWIFTIFTFH